MKHNLISVTKFRLLLTPLVIIILLVTGVSPTMAELQALPGGTLQLIGQLGGSTEAVAVQGNYAYFGVGHQLVILDISNPNNPVVIGQSGVFPDVLRDIFISGNYAYVADYWSGLRIVDIQDPSTPVEVGFYITPGHATHLTINNSLAYVASGSGGLRIINVADPAHPIEVGFYQSPDNTNDVAVVDNYAYIAAQSSGLRIVNISNPSSPFAVGFWDTPWTAYNLDIVGTYAYVADGASGLRIIDIADPVNPFEVGFLDTPGEAHGVSVVGSYAFVADWSHGLRIINVTNPSLPVEVVAYSQDWYWFADDLKVSGDFVYLASTQTGLRIINIENPISPIQVSNYNSAGSSSGVAIVGTYAYLADRMSGLRVIDITNPALPFQTGIVDTPHSAEKVALSGSYAFIADEGFSMRVIDISDPAAPLEVGFYNTNGLALDVATAGNYVYLIDRAPVSWGGLRILDITDPLAPVQKGFYPTPGYARNVSVDGNFAYVTLESGVGPYIINVSNPSTPVLVTLYDTPGYARDIAISGEYAYIADGENGLHIASVANPQSPFYISNLGGLGSLRTVAVEGNYAFVGGDDGVRVINVSDPTHPTEAVSYNRFPEPVFDLAVVGNYVYVADYRGGMYILRFTPPLPPDSIPPTTTDTSSVVWRSTDFTISLVCTDNLNGSGCKETKYRVDSGVWQVGNVISITTEGDHLIEYYSVDNANNQESVKYTHAKLDKTPPTIVASATTNPNSAGWYKDDVTLRFTCNDALSGIPADTCPLDQILSAEGAAVASTAQTVADAAGNTSADSNVVTVSIDKTAPVITWNSPINDGDSFYFGFVPPTPTCTATDNLSGVDGSCLVSGYATTVGSHILTATAMDNAGNQATEIRNYTVLPWTLKGFYQPVDMNGIFNIAKNGSTVPLKFEIFAGTTELIDIAYIKNLAVGLTACYVDAPSDAIELTATGNTSLRYDPIAGQFIYNWKTPSTPGKCYRVTLTTLDGSTLVAYFKLK